MPTVNLEDIIFNRVEPEEEEQEGNEEVEFMDEPAVRTTLKSSRPCPKLMNLDFLEKECCLAYIDPLIELAHVDIPTVCDCRKPVQVKHKKNGSALQLSWVREEFSIF